jgi:ferrous iron transport protein A
VTQLALEPAVKDVVLLSSVSAGARVRLVGIEAGHGLRARLAAMGLVPGVCVLMIANRGGGPAVVEVKGARLALGRGMAKRIRVK